ncbi:MULTISPECIES: alpha/beta hydrolase [Gammaproteobacteria]|uniref:alpha/beta hydrolase n=1 Tax=Gammaproteobacteria TaxID=1236 RepID=UPI001C498B07|nr:alpha/beta hydrolase [Pseudomonas sp. Hp2]
MTSHAGTTREGDLAFARQMRQDFKSSVASVGTPERVAEQRDFTVGAGKPERRIPVRLYLPANTGEETLPIVLFIHGGGFVAGDLDSYDPMLTGLANRTGAAVLSVDYRLAPENPFPAGLEDAYAVLKWAAKNASSFGADGSRIAISGDSAGGNIAAATAMLARDRHGPKLKAQLLMYPTVSNKMDTPSWKELGETHFPTREINSKVIDAYVPAGTSHYAPLVAPLWGDHQKLPPALIIVGNLDPLRDEDKDYAEKMRLAGGEAQVIVYPNAQHGFVQFYQQKDKNPDGEVALADGARFLMEKLKSE